MTELDTQSEKALHTELLHSKTPNDRLRAARFFLRNAERTDYEILRNALQTEDVRLVRVALADAIEVLAGDVSEFPHNDAEKSIDREALRIASREVSSEIIHEAEPIIGMIDLYASREIQSYTTSNTKKAVENLKHLFAALKEMRRVTRTPNISEASVAELVREAIDDQGLADGIEILSKVPDRLHVRTDPDIIKLVLRNVLKNAVEATQALDVEEKPPIVVDSNQNDRVWWISVIDEGIGIKGTPKSAFEFGTSSKSGHLGSGLATVQRGVETLEGVAKLERTKRGGTRFLAEWPV